MKRIVFFVYLFIIPVLTFSQAKKDNTIIVQGFVTYSALKQSLFKEGFVPLNSDTSFILTSSKSTGWIGEVSYLIQRTDTAVTFKGQVNAEAMGVSTGKMQLENVGSKGSVYREGFKLMGKIASSFGFPIVYLKL